MGWEIYGASEKQLAIYSFTENIVTQRMLQKYTDYVVCNLDMDSKSLNTLSIGKPFSEVEYRIENGELQIRGKTRAARILQGGVETQVDHDKWFATNDLAKEENGSYFIEGRRDDLIIGVSGENINPNLSEAAMQIQGADEKCLLRVRRAKSFFLYQQNAVSRRTIITLYTLPQRRQSRLVSWKARYKKSP